MATQVPSFSSAVWSRQGDPLSPSHFVLFLEPMLNYLRATTAHLGIPIVQDPTPHHISAFADDVTGLLRNLTDTPQFLRHVRHYAQPVGLQLNTSKTQVFRFHSTGPFSITSPNLPPFLVKESVRFLGVQQHSTPSSSERFASILTSFQSRLALWRFRARTLRGRAVLLRSIALPLLWYPAVVTPIPAAVLTSVWDPCKAFLFQQPLDPAQACRGPMAQDWPTRPPSQGGLVLPCPTSFSRAMHLWTLREVLRSCSPLRASRWFLPTLELMSLALHDTGAGLDTFTSQFISPQSLSHSGVLGSFWYSTLQQWYRLLRSSHNTTTRTHDTGYWLQAPPSRNYRRVCGRANRPLLYLSKHCNFLYQHGLRTLSDFLTRRGSCPTRTSCSPSFPAPSFTASVIARTFNDLGLLTGPISLGPFLP
uniref:Pollike protein putative n=1 Tax=Albugo laibachii Nc14 TaxID=890382 RepID=F0WVA4_9STRA|nr:pollike protein putative [Albugo laibachii Nc14]|eukprot:CCA25343.1 pollike protein putative [Albugo laibachii Nc14]